jgi:hypothetical protein|tara:strand:+ start:240 stop:494 length:255 start_codon:yes stop_codon:yes gene_type:complete
MINNIDDVEYVEMDASELLNVDFSLVEEDSSNTLRWNNERTKFIIKYTEGSRPDFIPSGVISLKRESFKVRMKAEGDWDAEINL